MKIALAFSGGGYRASAFSLGTLSYLDRVKIANNTLLSNVIALSTVSGGTITGGRYAIGIKQGETLNEIYHSLYEFFLKVDLVSLSLERLSSPDNWNKSRIKSLICAIADIYDSQLFKSSKFGILLSEERPIHLKHISFNATEFTTGVQFRFQISEKIFSLLPDELKKGIIGNYYNRIPEHIAKEIRMGDILAASSCFPGGFEPINFPTDFVLPDTKDVEKFKMDEKFPIGIMDGGIVDNQGVEPLLLAEERIKQNETSGDEKSIDLIILTDVSSPYMEEFKASVLQKENWWRRLTLRKIKITNSIVFVASLAGLVCSVVFGSALFSIISTLIFTISAILLTVFALVNKQIKKVDLLTTNRLNMLSSIKLVIFEGLLSNRIKSVLKLTGSVFMKSIRRLNYGTVYNDEKWENRRIMNAIYELNVDEYKTTNPIKEDLKPSKKIQEVSEKASSMATTLWFQKKDLDNNMLNAIIACGQYNICWNLLEYIEKIKLNPVNTNENHKVFLSCEEQLRKDWEMFKQDPFWLVNELNDINSAR